jgi:hypothetical protein
LGLYANAVTRTKREAQEKIVNQLLAAKKRTSETADFEMLWSGAMKEVMGRVWVAFFGAIP